jgi:hypothetical protein
MMVDPSHLAATDDSTASKPELIATPGREIR